VQPPGALRRSAKNAERFKEKVDLANASPQTEIVPVFLTKNVRKGGEKKAVRAAITRDEGGRSVEVGNYKRDQQQLGGFGS